MLRKHQLDAVDLQRKADAAIERRREPCRKWDSKRRKNQRQRGNLLMPDKKKHPLFLPSNQPTYVLDPQPIDLEEARVSSRSQEAAPVPG